LLSKAVVRAIGIIAVAYREVLGISAGDSQARVLWLQIKFKFNNLALLTLGR
jgi:transposase-like protein